MKKETGPGTFLAAFAGMRFVNQILLSCALVAVSASVRADSAPGDSARVENAPSFAAPARFLQDVAHRTPWLPQDLRNDGLQATYERHWNSYPEEIQNILLEMKIPAWLIALIPSNDAIQSEIYQHLRDVKDLRGPAPTGKLAARVEQLLVFGAAAELTTPGDLHTGHSLGAEGCTAAMSLYVIAELMLEFPKETSLWPAGLARTQSSTEMLALFRSVADRPGSPVQIVEKSIHELQGADVWPGSLMVGQKPGGSHSFGWTRAPEDWYWLANDKMAIGNTGLPQFGTQMILAQEYVSDEPLNPNDRHNSHGPINSAEVVRSHGRVDLTSDATNVYAARGGSFVLIRFID